MIQDAINIAKEALVKPFEGYHRKLPDGGCLSYPDPGTGGHPWTIGWGSTGPRVDDKTTWTLEQAETALRDHLAYFTTGLLKLSPSLVSASDRRVAALISFVYNCGLGNYRISTLKKRVDAGDWESAATEILKWNKAAGRILPGLTKRRKAEALLLQS